MHNVEGRGRSATPNESFRATPHFQIRDFEEIVGRSATEIAHIIAQHNYSTLWTYAVNCILGLWLITSPFLCDYKSAPLAISDIASGGLIIVFELLSFSPGFARMRWCTPAVAFWLLLAPLIFWSPIPAIYLNDTLIACFVITFSILVPGVPGGGGIELEGPDKPPGWTYNPSSWIRRWLGIALALLGFFISRYLAARQLGYISHAWDPFFGGGSDKVLTSVVSRSLPISDAGFGGVAYVIEVLTGFMGGRARWRSAPWIVVMFALLVLPLGATSVLLVITQPVVVGAWCGICLVAASALLISVPLAVHEAIAVGQFLLESRFQRKPLWHVFWMGGSIVGAGAADPDRFHYSLFQRWICSVQGVTVPWTIGGQLAIGIWLMALPNLLHCGRASANCDHLIGAMVVTIAAVSTAEVTRMARFINVPLGIALVVGAFLWAGNQPIVFCSELLSGIVLVVSSIPRGEIIEKYAGWDKFVK